MRLIDEVKYRVYTSKYKCIDFKGGLVEVREGQVVFEDENGARPVFSQDALEIYKVSGGVDYKETVDVDSFLIDYLNNNTNDSCSVISDSGDELKLFSIEGEWMIYKTGGDVAPIKLMALIPDMRKQVARLVVSDLITVGENEADY